MLDVVGKLDAPQSCCACRLHKRSAFRLTRPAHAPRCRQKTTRTRAAGDNGEDGGSDKDNRKSKKKKTAVLDDFNPVKLGRRSRSALNELLAVAEKADKRTQSTTAAQTATDEDPGIGAVNPIKLGRKSRAVLDNLWGQFTSVTSPTRSLPVTEEYSSAGEGLTEFETPQAAFTTVLVVGATGRIGRVLLRKLLLRGYKVKALIRQHATEDEEEAQRPAGIPQSVEIVYGDVSDYASCRAAAKGVDKIIYAAKSRSTYNVELKKVEETGPFNLAKAFMDVQNRQAQKDNLLPAVAKRSIADFGNGMDHASWKVTRVGAEESATSKVFDQGQNKATTSVNKHGNFRFKGQIYARNGIAETASPLVEEQAEELADCEGLVVRVRGDGQVYCLVLTTGTGAAYTFRFPTRKGYANTRMPFNAFRPLTPGEPPLDANTLNLAQIAIRFEVGGRNMPLNTARGSRQMLVDDETRDNSFDMEVDWIRALPGGDETDFIMVGCAGIPQSITDMAQHDKMMASKRRGENVLKNTGLGYTVIRAGPLLEEPGGYKALIFDQGNRITQGISCADVADVCVKSLHDTAARNKTFEVCYEYTPEKGLEMYELVAHLPDKSNNYLGPALAGLQKNT